MAGKNSQIPPDLEFTLEEISAELAKLGIRETSPTRLSAIKADLDQMIARDLALPTKADEDLSDHLQSDTTLTRSWSSTSLNSNHTVTNRTNHNTANGRRSFNPPRQAFVAASSPYGDVSSFTSDSSFQSLPPKDSGTEVTDDDDSILASGYGGTSDESVSSSSNSEYHHLAGDRRLPLIRNRPTRNLQHFATTNEGAVDHKNIPSVKITNEFDGNSEDGSHFTQDHSSWSSFFEDDAKYPLYQRRRRRNSISNHSVATNSNSMKGHFTPFDPSHTNLEGDKFADDRRGSTGAPRPIRRTRATAQVSVRVPSGTATRRPRRSPPEGVDNADDSSAWRSPCSSVVDRRRPSTAPLRGRPSRKKFDPVCRADPVTLWRLYSTEWSKHSRAVEMSERSLRWSVKEAMMVKEVPVLPSSARSVSHFGHHRPFNPGDGNFVGRRSASSYLMY